MKERFTILQEPRISTLNENTLGRLVGPDGKPFTSEPLIRRVPVENVFIFESIAYEYAKIGFTNAGGKFRRRTPEEQFKFARHAASIGLNVLPPLIIDGVTTYIPYLSQAETIDKYLPKATLTETARIIFELFYDMKFAHWNNVVYGDRWSQNVLVSRNKPPTHIDFDLKISGPPAKTFEVAQMAYYVLCGGREKAIDPVTKVLSNSRDWFDPILLSLFLRGHAEHFNKSKGFGNAEEITDRLISFLPNTNRNYSVRENKDYGINTKENEFMKDKIKLVIFDFDGLMVNSEQVIYDALRKFYKEYGYNFSWNYFCKYIGTPVQESLGHYYKDFPIPLSFDEFFDKRNEIVSRNIQEKLELMPYLREILDYLKKRNITIAIATSAKRSYVNRLLDKFGIKSYFQTIVSIDDVSRGKPYPDLIQKTLEKTGFSLDETLILEDSPNGIEAATSAGIVSIAIPTKGVPLEQFKKANLTIKDLKELLDLI